MKKAIGVTHNLDFDHLERLARQRVKYAIDYQVELAHEHLRYRARQARFNLGLTRPASAILQFPPYPRTK